MVPGRLFAKSTERPPSPAGPAAKRLSGPRGQACSPAHTHRPTQAAPGGRVGHATVKRPLANQFYGDRSGTIVDPFGHQWTLATHVEDVSPAEMERRMAAMEPA